MFFRRRAKIGEMRKLQGVWHVYCTGKWVPMVSSVPTEEVVETIEVIRKHVSMYIHSENIFIDNNPVLQELPRESRFPHVMYLINHSEIYDPILLETYRKGLVDDNHSNSYSRWLETVISIYVEASPRALDALLSRYINSIILLKRPASTRNVCLALSVFPWLYLLPIYNEIYTRLGLDIE